jgi:hypothetical protein
MVPPVAVGGPPAVATGGKFSVVMMVVVFQKTQIRQMWRYATARQYPILIPLCFSQITFKNGRTQITKGGYLKLKPCSDVDEKTQSKFIGFVRKNTAVSTLRNSQGF